MSTGELIEYLQEFPKESDFRVLVVNTEARQKHEVKKFFAITEVTMPVFGLIIGSAEPMDEDEKAACDEDEREAGEGE